MDEFRRTPVNKVAQPQVFGPQPVPQAQPQTNPSFSQQVPTQSRPPQQPQPILRPGHARMAPLPQQPQGVEGFELQPLDNPAGIPPKAPKKSKKKIIIWSIVGLLVALVLLVAGAFVWFNTQLAPVDSAVTDKKVVTIQSGSTPDGIAKLLEDEGLIRNQAVFLLQARIDGVQNKLQAGAYRLSPSESTPEIIEHLSNGKVDTFTITFLPGATLSDNRKVLIAAGYTATEVDTALAKDYTSPLFEGRPASADLEGYIYGETYNFGTDASVESILEHTFKEFYSVVEKNDLIAKFKAQGQTLYQGITLASIVQREASPGGSDMPDIAQVFYNRLAEGMTLGSDVTYQYAADKAGVPRDTNLDSPYNTRIKAGLPPGPIAAPGAKALIGTASPSGNNYLFFLSGDDDITYYGRTVQEHEANIKNHCQSKCQII